MPNAQQDSKHLNNNDITTNNVCCTRLNKADQNKQTVTWQQVRCKQRMGTLLIWGQKSGAVHFVESYCGWMVYFVESTSIIITSYNKNIQEMNGEGAKPNWRGWATMLIGGRLRRQTGSTWRRHWIFPFRKRSLPFWLINATIRNHAFSHERWNIFPESSYKKANKTFLYSFR